MRFPAWVDDDEDGRGGWGDGGTGYKYPDGGASMGDAYGRVSGEPGAGSGTPWHDGRTHEGVMTLLMIAKMLR